MNITKEQFIDTISKCNTKKDIHVALGIPQNGSGSRLINDKLKEFDIDFKINRKKYKVVKKICPVCESEFQTQKDHPREKTTCSYSCSNTYFRSGLDNPNYKTGNNYRTICFNHHEKKCVVCGEDKIVEVHHLDENHNNNEPENLIPLCPTHHKYWHSRHKHLIEDAVFEYWRVR